MQRQQRRTPTAPDVREELRLASTVGLAITATILAFWGLVWRQSVTSSAAPLPGMDHLWGQAAWALLVGVLMVAAAWTFRKAVAARLQWAVVASLLLHLLVLLVLRHVYLDVPSDLFAQPDETPGRESRN